jgi:hypothetical protein
VGLDGRRPHRAVACRLDDVAVEITPATWRSWTGSVLHEQTQRELAVDYDDAWLADDE